MGTKEEILDAALALSPEDRLQLLDTLAESLRSEPDPEIDAAWGREAHHRLEQVRRGEAGLVDYGDVVKEAEALLQDDA